MDRFMNNWRAQGRKEPDLLDWERVSQYQKLTAADLREFTDLLYGVWVSRCQKLTAADLREFKDRLHWGWVSGCQKLTAADLREFKDLLYWERVSGYQKLTAADLREFKDLLDWERVSQCQKAQPNKPERINRAKKYAAIHHLKTTEAGFYAYRNHDAWGRGSFNKAIIYASGRTYRDWHCDPRSDEENSFGLGIWPKGNTRVFVRYEDFCVAVDRGDGKARVWAFRI